MGEHRMQRDLDHAHHRMFEESQRCEELTVSLSLARSETDMLQQTVSRAELESRQTSLEVQRLQDALECCDASCERGNEALARSEESRKQRIAEYHAAMASREAWVHDFERRLRM